MIGPYANAEARIAELERRVLAGEDDLAYCLRWIAIHAALVRLAGDDT